MNAATQSGPRVSTQAPSLSGAMAGLSLAMLLSSLGTSIANAGLPTLARSFGATFSQVQWVVLSYLLVTTTLVVGIGRLGDILGRRRLLLFGVAVFILASLGCGIAPSLPVLIFFRAVQGLGAATMMVLAIAFVGDTIPSEKIGGAMGLLGTMSAAGTALGPSTGGVLTDAFGWSAIFLVNVPLGLVGFVLIQRHLPVDHGRHSLKGADFDWIGTALLAVALGAYSIALTIGRGTFGLLSVALLFAAGTGLWLFQRVESQSRSPLVQLNLVTALQGSLSANLIVATVMMSTLVVGPFYLSRALGLSPLWVGLWLSVGPIIVALGGIPAGRLADSIGTRGTTLIGLGAMVAGLTMLSLTSVTWGIPGYVGPISVVTAGYALFQTSNNAAVMSGVDAGQRGLVSALLTLARNIGLITGAAAMGAVFSASTGAADIAVANSASVEVGTRTTFTVAAVLVVVAIVSSRSRESLKV